MSFHTYKPSGLPNSGVVEQTGQRVWSLGSGIGRSDTLETSFVCLTTVARALVQTKFAAYAPHPTLPGFFCLPGSAKWSEKWTGLSVITASYLGMNIFPSLPDGYFVSSAASEMIFPGLEASDGTVGLQYGSAAIPEARMVYQTYYVEHVHYAADVPEVQKNVGRVYQLRDRFLPNSSAVLVLDYAEILETQGNYHHIRDRYIPILPAINQHVYSAFTDVVNDAGKLNGLDWKAMGLSVNLSLDFTLAELAMFLAAKTGDKLIYVAPTTDLSFTGCSIKNSVFTRQSR